MSRSWGYAYIWNPECPEDAEYDYEEYEFDPEKKAWVVKKRLHCVPHYNI